MKEDTKKDENRTKNSKCIVPLACSTGQQVGVKVTVSDAQAYATIETLGYYLPKGM